MTARPSMKPSEAAKELGVATKTVRAWLIAGHLEGFKRPSGTWHAYADSVAKLAGEKAPPDLDSAPY
jgi:predicted site-specific integrase-resolvase